jgi:hypothetical protein
MPLKGSNKAAYMKEYHQRRRTVTLVPAASDPHPSTSPSSGKDKQKPFKYLRLPKWALNQFDDMWTASKRPDGTFEWKNRQDAASQCFLNGMALRRNQGLPKLDALVKSLRAFQLNKDMARPREEAHAALEQTSRELKDLLQHITEDAAFAHYRECYRAFLNMQPHIWREWLLSQLAERFERLHTRMPPSYSMLSKDAVPGTPADEDDSDLDFTSGD